MKIFILMGLFVFGNDSFIQLNPLEEKMIKQEAASFCHCNKKLQQFLKKVDRANKKQERKEEKYRTIKSGEKLFGGQTFEFTFEKCMKNKRSGSLKKFLTQLSEEDNIEFRKKAKRQIKRNCGSSAAKYYVINL